MNKYIAFGKFNKIYLYIFLAYIILLSLSSGISYFLFYTGNINNYENPILIIFLIYFGQSLLFIPEIIINKCIFKSKNEVENSNKKVVH